MPDPNIVAAQELLANSYFMAARRATEALQRSLVIKNSREPGNPPNYPGEVVGLCGQGGRHAYFRVGIQAVRDTLSSIQAIQLERELTNERKVVEISRVCQQLRSATIFNPSTGCVNDRLPSMVPLLPPEEIWFEQIKLPLDIWRLISLEFDLVSSAVSRQLPVEDFAFGSVTPNGLIFRAMIGQLTQRNTSFSLNQTGVPAPWSTSLPSSVNVSLARIYFEAGCLLTPLATEDHIKWYSAIRYLHWISSASTDFRVKDQFKNDSIDSRYKGLFSEETAVGMMSVVLNDVFNCVRINNTVDIDPTLADGGAVADFIAESFGSTGKITIVAESKGSLGAIVSNKRKKRAKQQIKRTDPVIIGSTRTLRFAFCSSIWFETSPCATDCLIMDPPQNPKSIQFEVDPVRAWRMAYAKAFRFIRLESTANQVIEGNAADIRSMRKEEIKATDTENHISKRNRRADLAYKRFNVELLIDAGECAVALDSSIVEFLEQGINEQSFRMFEQILSKRRRHTIDSERSFISTLGFGCIFYSDLNQ